MPEDHTEENVSKQELKLELKALKSDLRLMIIASVALNQFLSNVQLPQTVSAVAILGAVFAPIFKGALVYFGARS